MGFFCCSKQFFFNKIFFFLNKFQLKVGLNVHFFSLWYAVAFEWDIYFLKQVWFCRYYIAFIVFFIFHPTWICFAGTWLAFICYSSSFCDNDGEKSSLDLYSLSQDEGFHLVSRHCQSKHALLYCDAPWCSNYSACFRIPKPVLMVGLTIACRRQAGLPPTHPNLGKRR